MKTVICLLLLFCLRPGRAQQLGLNEDPVFSAVLSRRMVFPASAYRAGIYTNTDIYTHFQIDSLGHIQDIVTINPSRTPFGFERIISRALAHLPPLKPSYAGNYILPVRFIFVFSKGVNFVEKRAPYGLNDNDIRSMYPEQILLSERRVETYGPRSYVPGK